ncbi:MAG: hypothetical protein ACTSVI_04830 [Promethearchaeota archaeon]
MMERDWQDVKKACKNDDKKRMLGGHHFNKELIISFFTIARSLSNLYFLNSSTALMTF